MAYARDRTLRRDSALHSLAETRVRGFLGIALAVVVGLSLKLVYVQVIRRGHYLELDRVIHRGPEPDVPAPGGIYARGLEPMAVSVPMVSVCANPAQVAASTRGISDTAREVAERTGLSAPQVREILERGARDEARFAYLARLLEPEQVAPLADVHLQGIWTVREYMRVYPGGRLACHVVGRCSDYHDPLDGIELRWAFLLAGKPGTRPKNLDDYGRSILGADSTGVLPPEPGRNVVLTIDWSLQQVVEMALDDCMERNRPRAATCVVMAPNTGEILALASRPNFDPAGLEAGTPDEINARLRNLPVVRQYEPGSLFKVLLAAAVLESPEYTPGQTYYCGGETEIGGEPLRCWEERGHGTCDLTRMVAKSCNIAAARFALLIGPEHYHDFLDTLGLGRRTGVALPGEAAGLLRPAGQMVERDLANLGFGHGVAVNDIQMLSAVCAVVNGGRLMHPQIVRAVLNAETGDVIRELSSLELRRVCSEETSASVRDMMGAVVDHGTGAAARIEGLRVGGKTGTAQKWIGGGEGFVPGRNILSFVMVAPLDEPRFAILVTADEPAIGEHGADVAAPVAKAIAVAALRQAGLLPEQAEISEDIGV